MTHVHIGVLALQGDVPEHLEALRASGARVSPVRRTEELVAVDGLVIPGGESTTLSHLLRVFSLEEPLRAQIAGGMPVYGSCAGMILLASAVLDGRPDQLSLGALDIAVRRNAFGRQTESFEADLEIAEVEGGPYRAVFIRAPWVEKVGPDVQILARIGEEASEGRIVAARQGAVLVTAFHPELTSDLRLHRLFVTMVEEQQSSPGTETSRRSR
jgi:5'-phosphate synthase pdxT subunit